MIATIIRQIRDARRYRNRVLVFDTPTYRLRFKGVTPAQEARLVERYGPATRDE